MVPGGRRRVMAIGSAFMMRYIGGLALGLAGWLVIGSAAADEPSASAWSRTDHAQVRLISATDAVGAAETLRLGLEFRLAPGWKIYWRSPGDAGLPPRIDWAGSENFASAAIRWPAPERFELFGLDTFGYGGNVVLPIDMHPARPGEPIRVQARVDYLVCEKICIPYDADLAMTLPAGPPRPSAHGHGIDRFNARVPGDGRAAGLAIERAEWVGGDTPALIVSARSAVPFAAPDVFVEAPSGWTFGRPSVVLSEGGTHATLRVPTHEPRSDGAGLVDASATFTLVDGERAAERTLVVERGATPAASWGAWAAMLGLAVLGGFILNLMPCVLPVLSLKLLNVVSHAGAARGAIRANFLASAAGILTAFMVLAAGLVALSATGQAIGWGIQFQAPIFLAFMALLVTIFAANLWGWFEIRLPRLFAAAGERLPARDDGRDLSGAFLSGIFATLLATPCSAPFLGTAVGFAIAGGSAAIVSIFAALGIGLALPYLAVAAAPGLARALPRPGQWMVTLRRLLGLALLATALWLLWVLAASVGVFGAAALGAVLAFVLGFLWVVREAGTTRRWLRPFGLAVLAGLALVAPSRFEGQATAVPQEEAGLGWRAFDRAEIAGLIATGHVVFVDVTADWCITCQANKALVLSRGEVARRLAGEGPEGSRLVLMRADWTLPDQRIADYLASHGRYGIPFNAVYGPGAPSGIALPELLTPDAVLSALDRAGASVAMSPVSLR